VTKKSDSTFEQRMIRYSSEEDISFHVMPFEDGLSTTYQDGATFLMKHDHPEDGQIRIIVPGDDLKAIGMMFLRAAEIYEGE